MSERSAAERMSEQTRLLEYHHLAATKTDLLSHLANHKTEKNSGKILPIFLLFPGLNVQSRPVPFIPRDGTGRDGIGTGFSKMDGILPTLIISE